MYDQDSEVGRVISREGEQVLVEFSRSESCKGCSARHLCMTFGVDRAVLRLPTKPGVEIGKRVRISFPQRKIIWGSLVIFLWPIIALIVASASGYTLAMHRGAESSSDTWAIIAGIGGLAAAFLVIYIYDRWLKKKGAFLPEIVEILD